MTTTTTTNTRARSRSVSAISAAAQKTADRHDGVNLYAPEPISETRNQLIDGGRANAIAYMKNPSRVDGVDHAVEFVGICTEGNATLDKFRIMSHSKGFTTEEMIKFHAYGGKQVEGGANTRTVFVYVPHTRYDRRWLGLDMDARDWMWAAFATVTLGLLAYGTAMSDTFMNASASAKLHAA